MKKIIFIFLFLAVFISQAEITQVTFKNNSGVDVHFHCDAKNISPTSDATEDKDIENGDTRYDIKCLNGKNIVITKIEGAECTVAASGTSMELELIKPSGQGSKYILKRKDQPNITCCPTGETTCS